MNAEFLVWNDSMKEKVFKIDTFSLECSNVISEKNIYNELDRKSVV